VEVECGWRGVADTAGFVGFLDAVTVVAGAFDGAGAGAVASFGVDFVGDFGEDFRYRVVPVLRGKCPPYRWRYGGWCAGRG
jgi:hypothetical protein